MAVERRQDMVGGWRTSVLLDDSRITGLPDDRVHPANGVTFEGPSSSRFTVTTTGEVGSVDLALEAVG